MKKVNDGITNSFEAQEAYLLKKKWKKHKKEGRFCWSHKEAGPGLYDISGAIKIEQDMEKNK
jgi:hypothetical protein